MSKTIKATIAGLLGYSIFGFSFLFSKIALDITTPDILLSARFTVAFVILNLFLLTKKAKISLKGKPVMKLMLMGFIQPVIYFICESYGISLTSASFSGVIIGLVPVMGLIFGVLFLKEKCNLFQIFCTVMSVVGVALTTTGGVGEFSFLGFFLLMLSVISTTAFTVLSRSISEQFSAFERTYVMTALGSVFFTLIALFKTKSDFSLWTNAFTNTDFWGSVLYLSVVSSVIAFLLINYALCHLSVGHTLIFSNFTSVISVLAGIFIMGDSFTPLQLTGIVVIILSVFGVSYYKGALEKKKTE